MMNVQRGRWFVEQQYCGFLGENAGEHDTLLFPAGQRGEIARAEVEAIRSFETLFRDFPVVLRQRTQCAEMRVTAQTNRLKCGEGKRGAHGLGQEGDALRAAAMPKACDGFAVQLNFAGGRPEQPSE